MVTSCSSSVAYASLQAKMFSSRGSSASCERRLLPFSSSDGCCCYSPYLEKQHRILPNSLQRLLLPITPRAGGGHTTVGWHRQSKSCLQQLFIHNAGFLHMNFTNELCRVRVSVPKHFLLHLQVLMDLSELSLSIEAYMSKYDSRHSPFKGSIKVVDVSTLEINGKQIKLQATGNRKVPGCKICLLCSV